MQRKFEFGVYNPTRNVWYFATKRLGGGGQGGVWAGVNEAGASVALKIIWPSSNAQRDYWAWFNDQHAHLECLNQPYVVRSYDQFQSQPEGWYVIVMEPAVRSLDDVISTGQRQPPLRVCAIGTQILSALSHLHSINRIHRDVSAKNILELPDGKVKLSDFGVSKGNVAAGEATGTQLGNALYLPPELLNANRWTHQSDVYQLGVVLISLLIGRHVIPPNVASTAIDKMIRDGVPRQTAGGLVATHGDLGSILSRMVCRTENLRYPTARAAWDALYNEWHRQNELQRVRSESFKKALAIGAGAGLALLAALAIKG